MEPQGPARVERRLAAILAADVAGYSRLMEVDEEGTLSRLKSLRTEVIDPAIAGHPLADLPITANQTEDRGVYAGLLTDFRGDLCAGDGSKRSFFRWFPKDHIAGYRSNHGVP